VGVAEKPLLTGKLAKFAAIVAALGVLWVLITPALDELPCTAGHKLFAASALSAAVTPFILQSVRASLGPIPNVECFFGLPDVLSLTCLFLC
jgi:hypothetical protein